jgi:DNA modification methylase
MSAAMLVRARAERLPWRDQVAQACVTSPPYWGLRRYGTHPDELGTEDLHIYLARLVQVFREVRRVLRPDGLAWVNIADTYAGSGGAGGDYLIPNAAKRARRRAPVERLDYRQARPTVWRPNGTYGEVELDVLVDGQRCNIPGRLATALQDDGWRLRSVITWAKTSTRGQAMARPEDLAHANRPGVSSETILLLAPGPARSAFEPACLTERGDVWHIPPVTGRYRGPAPYPDELARRCITPSTVRGDLVIDPFHGSGTTGRVARALGRRYVGADLYTHPHAATGRPIARTRIDPGRPAAAQLDLFGGAA